MKLWMKIFIGRILGVIAGLVLKDRAVLLKPLGTLFINAIQMLIVPLVFSSLIVGMTGMRDNRQLGRIGIKTLVIYLVTTAANLGYGSPSAFANMFKRQFGVVPSAYFR